jgi:alanyl-tRNA synthetase
VSEVPQRIDALQAEKRSLEKALADAKRALATGGGGASAAPEEIGGIKIIARVLDGVGGKDLRGIAEDFKKQVGSGLVALVGTAEGKAAVTVAVSADLVGRFNAAELAKAAVLAMGGQGAGGKPDFAQGGAPDAAKADEGLAAIRAAIGG